MSKAASADAAHAARGGAVQLFGVIVQLLMPAYHVLAARLFGQAAFGTYQAALVVLEFCNSSNGFQVIASHRPLNPEEIVEVDFGGEFARLSQGGVSSIAFRSGARFGSVPFSIDAARLDSSLAVSFSLIAI